jgi:hypothetical protein
MNTRRVIAIVMALGCLYAALVSTDHIQSIIWAAGIGSWSMFALDPRKPGKR